MPSRRYPQLVTHNPSGRLLAQPLWFAPKLHRAGEVMDVHGARQISNMHCFNTSPQNQPRRSGHSSGLQFRGRGSRSAGFSRGRTSAMKNCTRNLAASSSRSPSRSSKVWAEIAQEARTEASVDRLRSGVSMPPRGIPTNASSNLYQAHAPQPLNNTSARNLQYPSPHESSLIPLDQNAFAHIGTEGSVERFPLGVPSPGSLQAVPHGSFSEVMNPVSVISPQRKVSTRFVSRAIPEALVRYAPGGLIEGIPVGVSRPLPSFVLGRRSDVYLAASIQTMNNSSSVMMSQAFTPHGSLPISRGQGICSQPSQSEELVDGLPSRPSTRLRDVVSRIDPDVNPALMTEVMNFERTVLTQHANLRGTPPTLQGQDTFVQTGRTGVLDERCSPGASAPILGSGIEASSGRMGVADLTQPVNLAPMRFSQGPNSQGPRVWQAQGEYGHGGGVDTAAAHMSTGLRQAHQEPVGVLEHPPSDGIQPQNRDPFSILMDTRYGEKEYQETNVSSDRTARPPESDCVLDDLPVIPSMEELIRNDGMALPRHSEPTVDRAVTVDVLDELEEMLHRDEAVPVDEESWNILNTFSPSDEVMGEADDVEIRLCEEDDSNKTSEEDQIDKIVDLERELSSQADASESVDDVNETGNTAATTDENEHVSEGTEIKDGASDTDIIADNKNADTLNQVSQPMEGESEVKCPKQFTSNDYGRLQKALKMYGAYNKEELMKVFPGRSYEDVLQRIRYYFPGAISPVEWGIDEHRRLFNVIGDVVDWDCVAGHMNCRSVAEVKRYYFGLLRR